MEGEPRIVKIPGQRLVDLAARLIRLHPLHGAITPATSGLGRPPPVKIVCISDSHNNQPDIPSGDVLIHAGDLTENGSFDELQSQLKWLSAQPHKHKVVISGNHDVLLDEQFLEKHAERRYGETRTAADLDWGSVQYLRDASTTLTFPHDNNDTAEARRLKVFGSPWTPRYGISAFQYPREEDIWSDRIPNDADILVTHGPPRLYLDTAGFQKAGCVYLAKKISRVRPRLVIFGHIHAGYGRMDVALDTSRQLHDDILNRWGGYWTLCQLAVAVSFAKLRAQVLGIKTLYASERITTFINASVVGGSSNEVKHKPTIVVV